MGLVLQDSTVQQHWRQPLRPWAATGRFFWQIHLVPEHRVDVQHAFPLARLQGVLKLQGFKSSRVLKGALGFPGQCIAGMTEDNPEPLQHTLRAVQRGA